MTGMAIVLQHKVVAALPSPLEPDSIYYLRVGQGFDIHVTNGLGEVVAYSLNAQVAIENLPEWSTAETADEALTALGMSASGKIVATGNATQGREALGLGTAATRDVGEASGNVMEVGAFGLGVENAGGDYHENLDNILKSGFYAAQGGAVGGVSGADGGCLVMVGRNDTKQLGWDGPGVLRFRGNDNPLGGGGWSEWYTIYHSGNFFQTWANVSSSRALNTNYTNNTGRAIFVTWHVGVGSGAISIDVGGSSKCSAFVNTDTFNLNTLVTIVPAGASYRFSVVAGSFQKGTFWECR